MAADPVSSADVTSFDQLQPFEPWAADRLRVALSSQDAAQRVAGLAMAVQPAAPVDAVVSEIARAAGLARDDEGALMMAAAALGAATTGAARAQALTALCVLARIEFPASVRRLVAKNFWGYQTIPAAAWPSVAQMVFSDDAELRQVAFAAAIPHAREGAREIVAQASVAGPPGWTTEGMDLLAASAGQDESRRTQVLDYVMRSLAQVTSLPALVAGNSALARLNPDGPAVLGLCALAAKAENAAAAQPALNAITQLGDRAGRAVPELVVQLKATDDPEREEALCKTLLAARIAEQDVPLPRVIERVRVAPDRAVAAHCMLIAMHAKAFAKLAPVIAERFARAEPPLQTMLDCVYEMLTGQHLLENPPKFAA